MKRPKRRIDATALIIGDMGSAVLLRNTASGWSLPGSVVREGEHPSRVILNTVKEATGLEEIPSPRLVALDQITRPADLPGVVEQWVFVYDMGLAPNDIRLAGQSGEVLEFIYPPDLLMHVGVPEEQRIRMALEARRSRGVAQLINGQLDCPITK